MSTSHAVPRSSSGAFRQRLSTCARTHLSCFFLDIRLCALLMPLHGFRRRKWPFQALAGVWSLSPVSFAYTTMSFSRGCSITWCVQWTVKYRGSSAGTSGTPVSATDWSATPSQWVFNLLILLRLEAATLRPRFRWWLTSAHVYQILQICWLCF